MKRRYSFSLLPALYFLLPALFIILIALWQNKVPRWQLLLDSNALCKQPFYTGFISNIGILMWSAAAAVSALASIVLNRGNHTQRLLTKMLATLSVFSLVLCFDDLFQIHEDVFPNYLHIPQEVLYCAYAAIFVIIIFAYRTLWNFTPYGLLLLSISFFAMSLCFDTGFCNNSRGAYLLEDVNKFFGITAWLAYCSILSYRSLRGVY